MNKVQKVTVSEAFTGQRLDNYLLRELKGVPRSMIYRIIRSGEVRVDGGRVKPHFKLAEGMIVRIPPVRMSMSGETRLKADKKLLNTIAYEDELMLIIDKPPGLAVHGGSGVSMGLIESIRLLRPHSQLELAHRLDRETSGCILLTKKRSVLRGVQSALREKGGVRKSYLAVVDGAWPRRKQRIDVPLKKNLLKSGERITRVDAEGKDSVTRFQWLCSANGYTLLRVWPETGRTHQIRVHCQYAGFPIVGDPKYGCVEKDKMSGIERYWRMMLHAESLEFPQVEGLEQHLFHVPPTGRMLSFIEDILGYDTQLLLKGPSGDK